MHRSLDQLSNTVLVDTNVLLNGCFIAESAASYSISWLTARNYSLIIDQSIEEEALRILRLLQKKLKLNYCPVQALKTYLKLMAIVLVKSTDLTRNRHVNIADQHVFSTAIQFHAWILTADIKLAAELQQTECDNRLPVDIVMEALTRKDGQPPINYMFRFIGLSKDQGCIFARVFPGNWAGQSNIGRFTVCEVANVGRLFYDTDSTEWVFRTKLNSELRLNCELRTSEEWLLSASYEFNSQSNRGNITLRGKSSSGNVVHGSTAHSGIFTAERPGTLTLGHSAAIGEHWNGNLKHLLAIPSSMNKRTWKALCKVPEATPDPLAGNALELALRLTYVKDAKCHVPTEREISRFWR